MSTMIQVSPRTADGTLYNIKSEAESADVTWAEFGSILSSIGGSELAHAIRDVINAALIGSATAGPAQPAAAAVHQSFPQAQVASSGTPPLPAAAQPAAPGAAPMCQHGEKKLVSGTSAKTGNAWRAWGCPARKDDPTKCGLDFIRG